MRLSEFLTDIGQPFAYYPQIAKLCGGVKEGIFLCRIVWWQRESGEWVTKTMDEIADATGLSLKEQRSARMELKALGLLKEMEDRLAHELSYRVDLEALDALWDGAGISRSAQTAFREVPKRHSGKCPNGIPSIGKDLDKDSTQDPPYPPEGGMALERVEPVLESEAVWPSGPRPMTVEVVETRVARKPKAEKPPPNPDHSKLIALWTDAYLAEFGCAYAFAGGRDARAVKTLLDTSKRTPEEIVELAGRAWKESGYPFAGASALHTFATGINLIAAELAKRVNGTHKNGNGKVPAWQERKEWQDQLKRAEDEIKTLMSGDSHADLDWADKATLKRARAVRDDMRQKLGYKI